MEVKKDLLVEEGEGEGGGVSERKEEVGVGLDTGSPLVVDDLAVAAEDVVLLTSLWDWPLNENGVAKAVEYAHKFTVSLTFGYLQHCVQIRKFENTNSCTSNTWSVGLSPADTTKSQYFWRLEIQICRKLNMLVVEAFREMLRTAKGRHLKKVRKMYTIPSGFDMDTLQATISKDGSVHFECQRKAPRPKRLPPRSFSLPQ